MLLDATSPCQFSEVCLELAPSAHFVSQVNNGAGCSTVLLLCSVTQKPGCFCLLSTSGLSCTGKQCDHCLFPSQTLLPVGPSGIGCSLHRLACIGLSCPCLSSDARRQPLPTCSTVGSATPSLKKPGPPVKAAWPSCALAGGPGPHTLPALNWLWLSYSAVPCSLGRR